MSPDISCESSAKADDSHEMSRLIFFKNILKNVVVVMIEAFLE